MENSIAIDIVNDLVKVSVTGKLTKEMYEQFVPVIEQELKEYPKLRMLFVMHDFHGWTAGALWDDIKFDVQHWNDIERLAIVGDSKWEQGMSAFCKPFTSAKVRYFDHGQLQEAEQWVSDAS